MPDSSLITNALIAKLGADSTLLGLMPNGIYYAEAPVGATRFVVVWQILGTDVPSFGKRSIEDRLFGIEARSRRGSGGDVQAAAARIDALLDPQPPAAPATLPVTGYGLMTIQREEFLQFTERDSVDPSILWDRRGGQYRVAMSVE